MLFLDATPLETFVGTIPSVLGGLITNLASVTTALIGNALFQFGVGIMVFGYLVAKIVKLIKKGRR